MSSEKGDCPRLPLFFLQADKKVCKPACKPGSVPRLEGVATVIYLACRLPDRSSGLPESRSGPDQSCSLIWPCSRWGLPSQPVTRLLVGSYIKGLKSPRLFTLTFIRNEPDAPARSPSLARRAHYG
jgi:hypothetical protein